MSNSELRFRQIHLDFHTSGHILVISSEFDPEEFAATLERARVDSITCFARCHHGWIYFDTTSFHERRHPHHSRNLLKEQIEACHARDIRVPIYVTVQWDHLTSNEHPEWRVVSADGRVVGTPPYEAGFYRKLCLNSPYLDFLKAHTQEILEPLQTDGLFFDIVQPVECSCKFCRTKMEAEGLEPSDSAARQRFGLETINHFKLETLPSGGWGYMYFPVTMHYARTLGLECLGQTGKFHTSWGDFHSFKNLAALQYECFRMLAMGASA